MYRVTHALSVGRFLTPERVPAAREFGVTHVLNVSDTPNLVTAGPHTFAEVAWEPLPDFKRIPEYRAAVILHTLHRLAIRPAAHVYVHCVAGQQRSPTIIWLYLIACGLEPDSARDWIEDASPDAVPGHHRLADDDLALFVQTHGPGWFLPLPRSEIMMPVWR
jgi:hypothetical protein